MSDRTIKYGGFFFCSIIFFSIIFTILFAGFSGAFSSSGNSNQTAIILGAIPGGIGIGFIITIFGLLYFICQEEG
ncbi:MAG: hypothetical protein RTV72_15500 [Candidatus Thorarchaeota archaeon]